LSKVSENAEDAMKRFVNAVERVGNVVPHPVVIFLILIGGLIIISAIASLFGASAGSVRRGHVKVDDIAHLVDEQRIARQLECLAPVRLQAERHPHSADRGWEKPVSAAIERIAQCVASTGVVRKVCSITAAA
jgi:hypothetical protein